MTKKFAAINPLSISGEAAVMNYNPITPSKGFTCNRGQIWNSWMNAQAMALGYSKRRLTRELQKKRFAEIAAAKGLSPRQCIDRTKQLFMRMLKKNQGV